MSDTTTAEGAAATNGRLSHRQILTVLSLPVLATVPAIVTAAERRLSRRRRFITASLSASGLLCAVAGRSLPSLKWLSAGLMIVAGCVPLVVQLRTGFAFDRTWVARYSRSTEPARYWASILLGVLVVAFWTYGAILLARA